MRGLRVSSEAREPVPAVLTRKPRETSKEIA